MNIPQVPSRPTLLATLAIALAALAMSGEAAAAGTASERSNIEVMIRQLNAVEAVAQRSTELPAEDGARYRMDYTRLAADIARIRQGLEGYLAPSRAQPRDPVELSGSYQHEAASP